MFPLPWALCHSNLLGYLRPACSSDGNGDKQRELVPNPLPHRGLPDGCFPLSAISLIYLAWHLSLSFSCFNGSWKCVCPLLLQPLSHSLTSPTRQTCHPLTPGGDRHSSAPSTPRAWPSEVCWFQSRWLTSQGILTTELFCFNKQSV